MVGKMSSQAPLPVASRDAEGDGRAGAGAGSYGTRSVHVRVLPQEKTDSGWFATLKGVPPARELTGDVDTEWLVVGGGWFGVNAARRVAEINPDDRILLIDAGRIGNNAAGRCAGFAIDLAHNPRNKAFAESVQENRNEALINREGIAYLRDAVERHGLQCDWSPEGKIHVAASDRGERCLETLADAMDRIDEPYEWYGFDRLKEITGTSYYRRGLFTPGTVLMQPAAMLRGIAENLPGNVTVFEDSPITEVVYGASWHRCVTSKGTVRAGKIILANNGFLSYFGFYEDSPIPIYTYGSLTRPLSAEELARIGGRKTFGLIPADPFGTTVRRTADNRLFIRNIYAYARDFKTSRETIERARKRHQRSFEARFPEVSDIGFEYSWGGALCLSQNGGVVFGELAERVFAAGYCNGVGVSRGAVYGKAIAEFAAGMTSPTIEILKAKTRPSRAYPRFVLEPGVKLNTGFRLLMAGPEV